MSMRAAAWGPKVTNTLCEQLATHAWLAARHAAAAAGHVSTHGVPCASAAAAPIRSPAPPSPSGGRWPGPAASPAASENVYGPPAVAPGARPLPRSLPGAAAALGHGLDLILQLLTWGGGVGWWVALVIGQARARGWTPSPGGGDPLPGRQAASTNATVLSMMPPPPRSPPKNQNQHGPGAPHPT